MNLTQKQLARHTCGYEASRLMHRAISEGCKITFNERGRRMVDICELVLKTGDRSAVQIAESLRVKVEYPL